MGGIQGQFARCPCAKKTYSARPGPNSGSGSQDMEIEVNKTAELHNVIALRTRALLELEAIPSVDRMQSQAISKKIR